MTVVEGEAPVDDTDLESGGVGRRRKGGLRRVARWFWPSPLTHAHTHLASSSPAESLPGHDFPISPSALSAIRFKTYGLRTRRRLAIRRSIVDPDDPGAGSDDDEDDAFAPSDNEYEFDSGEGYEVDEIEEYGMI